MDRADQNKLAPGESVVAAPIALIRRRRILESGPAVPKTRKVRERWIWPVTVFVCAAGLTFLAIYVYELLSGSSFATPRFVQAMLPDPSLGLHVEYQGGEYLLVTWNRRSPTVRAAVSGVLRIIDGEKFRDVHLDREQVAGGSILYRPASDDVTFHLELRNAQGNATVGSIRVLASATIPANASAAPQPDALAPAQPAHTSEPATAKDTAGIRRRRANREISATEPDRETESPAATEPANSAPSAQPTGTSSSPSSTPPLVSR